MTIIADQWDEFAASVLPKPCSRIQHNEMRLAFFSGAHTMLAILQNTPEEWSEEQLAAFVSRLQDELKTEASSQLDRLTNADITSSKTKH